MSAQHRVDPLSRLLGSSAPPVAPSHALEAGPSAGGSADADPEDHEQTPTRSRVSEQHADDLFTLGESDGGRHRGTHTADTAVTSSSTTSSAATTTTGARGRPGAGSRVGAAKVTNTNPSTSTPISVAATAVGAASAADALADPAGAPPVNPQLAGESARPDPLEALVPAIDQARTFAERWDAAYRSEVFRVALSQLLGPRATATPSVGAPIVGAARGMGAAMGAAAPVGAPRPAVGLGPTEKLARALDADPDAVDRAVQFAEGGKPVILGRLEAKTRRELQTKYGLVYLYVKEVALSTRLVDIEELRAVCVDHGCYDLNNFTANYKKAQQDGLMREQPTEKGSRTRRYMLTQKGMTEAAVLLRELVLQ